MKNLTIKNHKGINVIDSTEVAEMMEIEHWQLLRKIDNINEDFTDNKIVVSKYWEESTYRDSSGKSNRKFLITKRGCEFLAHKTTGTKGNLFTDRYMDRFAEMENYIEKVQVPNIELSNQMLGLAQSTQMMAQVVQGIQSAIGGIQTYVQDSIQAKDKQIDNIAELVGLRSKNVCLLTRVLKKVIATKYKVFNVNANMGIYIKAKEKVFKEFKVSKWEDIPVGQYATVQAFIEECI